MLSAYCKIDDRTTDSMSSTRTESPTLLCDGSAINNISPITPGMAHAKPTKERELGTAAEIFTAVNMAMTTRK